MPKRSRKVSICRRRTPCSSSKSGTFAATKCSRIVFFSPSVSSRRMSRQTFSRPARFCSFGVNISTTESGNWRVQMPRTSVSPVRESIRT